MQSYWQREAAWRDRWDRSALPDRVDFAVLGGGFAGLATAIRIRERAPDATIAVLEAERVGFGASGRSAGFLSPLAAPVWLLGAERVQDHAWAAAKINAEVHELAGWIAERAGDVELARVHLGLVAGDRLGEAALGEFVQRVRAVGLAHQVRPSRAREGQRFLAMDAYTLHPYKLAVGLAEHAVREGIAIRERARVTALEGTRVTYVGGELEATCVVSCTNAYQAFAPVRAAVVHSFLTATAPLDDVTARRLVRDGEFTVEVNAAQAYHRMHAGRVIYGGVDKLWSPDDEVPASVGAALAKCMKASFPEVHLAPGETWSGRFHATANGLPILERRGAHVINVGYGGTGVALALACARRAAALACGEPDDRLLSIIRTTRIGVRDSIHALARIAGRLSSPWR